jgi:hypothetical protein
MALRRYAEMRRQPVFLLGRTPGTGLAAWWRVTKGTKTMTPTVETPAKHPCGLREPVASRESWYERAAPPPDPAPETIPEPPDDRHEGEPEIRLPGDRPLPPVREPAKKVPQVRKKARGQGKRAGSAVAGVRS